MIQSLFIQILYFVVIKAADSADVSHSSSETFVYKKKVLIPTFF